MKNTIYKNHSMTIFIFILFFTGLLFSGCAEDDGSNPCQYSCLNGGICDNFDTCNCPPGYFGTTCQNYDPCYLINCESGTCVNGNCICNEGYYGSECQFVKIPSAVRITQIDLMEWPQYQPNGNVWDSNSGRPDIFLTIDINGSQVSTTGYHEQCSLNNEYSYPDSGGGLPIYISRTNYKVLVWLWDYDGNNSSQNMGGMYFYPDDYQSSLPETKVLSNSDLQIKYRVHFDWIF